MNKPPGEAYLQQPQCWNHELDWDIQRVAVFFANCSMSISGMYRLPGSRFDSLKCTGSPSYGGRDVFAKKPGLGDTWRKFQFIVVPGLRGLYWGWHDWKIWLVQYPATSPIIQHVSKSIILELSLSNIWATYFTIMPEISWSSFCSSMLHAAGHFCIGIPCCSSAGDLGPRNGGHRRPEKKRPAAMASFTPRTSRNAPLLPGDCVESFVFT